METTTAPEVIPQRSSVATLTGDGPFSNGKLSLHARALSLVGSNMANSIVNRDCSLIKEFPSQPMKKNRSKQQTPKYPDVSDKTANKCSGLFRHMILPGILLALSAGCSASFNTSRVTSVCAMSSVGFCRLNAPEIHSKLSSTSESYEPKTVSTTGFPYSTQKYQHLAMMDFWIFLVLSFWTSAFRVGIASKRQGRPGISQLSSPGSCEICGKTFFSNASASGECFSSPCRPSEASCVLGALGPPKI